MGSKTNYLEDKLVNHVLRNTAYTSPTTIYLALLTADPTDTGSQVNEVSGGSYAREIITFDAPSPSGQTQSAALITFTTPTGSWGTVSHWAVVDALTTGNYLYHGAWDTAKAVGTGDDPEVAVGEVEIDED